MAALVSTKPAHDEIHITFRGPRAAVRYVEILSSESARALIAQLDSAIADIEQRRTHTPRGARDTE